MTTLIIRGAEIELDESESFNKVKQRIEKAKQNRLDYKNGSAEEFVTGATELKFKVNGGGRIFIDVDDCFGCLSDLDKDGE